MSATSPTQAFCTANGLDYPLNSSLYHPKEFSFDGFASMLKGMMLKSAGAASARSMQSVVHMGDHQNFSDRVLCVMIPVLFSPSNAVKLAETIATVSRHIGQPIPATFLFGDGLTYKTEQAETQQAVAKIARMGFEIGVLATLYADTTPEKLAFTIRDNYAHLRDAAHNRVTGLGFHALGTPNTRALAASVEREAQSLGLVSLLEFKSDGVAICATRHGLYHKGHPLELYTEDHKAAVLQVPSDWYSQTPKDTPLARMAALPEVRGADVMTYRKLVSQPIYGEPGTFPVRSVPNDVSLAMSAGPNG